MATLSAAGVYFGAHGVGVWQACPAPGPAALATRCIGANNWPFAAASSVIFMFAVLIVVYLLNLLTRMTPADAKS